MNRRDFIKSLIGLLPALALAPKIFPTESVKLVSKRVVTEGGFVVHSVELPQKTGDFEITGLGFKPSAILFWNGSGVPLPTFSFGIADKIDGQLDIVSFTPEGVQVKNPKGHTFTVPY